MWKPDESLDDFTIRPKAARTVEPPPEVLLRPSNVEILKPLIRELPLRVSQPLWFRRLIGIGSGALVTAAIVLVSAILIGVNEPAGGPDVATIAHSEGPLTIIEEPFSDESSTSFAPVTGGLDSVLSKIRRTVARPNARVAVYKPKRQLPPPPPEFGEPTFVPTTLVIYAENGVINTRIEPWVQ